MAQDVLNMISRNAADLSDKGADLSVATMTNIFGDHWWNLVDMAGKNGKLVYSLLEVLNSCCAIVVAWLMIFTILIASMGSAQEGRSIGGKFSSAWVPLRLSFSFAAITPVFNGLCAMQILILACIGVSIDLANQMFVKGVKEITENRTISNIMPPKLTGVGFSLAAGALQSQILIRYLNTQVGCNVTPVLASPITTKNYAIVNFEIPNNGELVCNGKTMKVSPTAFGGFKIPIDDDDYQVRLGAIHQLVADTAPIAEKAANLDIDYATMGSIMNAGKKYTETVYNNHASRIKEKNLALEEATNLFNDIAETKGWFTFGSYYWTLANAAQRHLDSLNDTSSYHAFDLNDEAAALLGYSSWQNNVVPALNKIKETVSLNPAEDMANMESNASIAITNPENLSWIGKIFNYFDHLFDGAFATGAANMLSGPDAIITVVQLGRKLANLASTGIIAIETVKIAAAGAKSGVENSLWTKVVTFGTGADAGIASAIYQAVADGYALALLALVTLWTYGTFIAYILPAIPFFIWLAAIVGWVVLCLEAVIAAPIWLVGHAMPEGEGFAGQHGRTGYMLILSILIRPLLLVIAMFSAMIIMQATGALIGPLFAPFAASQNSFGFASGLGPVGSIFLFILLSVAIMILTWKIFDLVTQMPDRILRWVGQLYHQLGADNAVEMAGSARGAATKGATTMGKTTNIATQMKKNSANSRVTNATKKDNQLAQGDIE